MTERHALTEPMPSFDPGVFHARLARDGLLWAPVVYRSQVDSTQTLLRRHFAELPGLPGYWRVALADVQTDGRGRTGARWLAEPGAGLLMTLGTTLPVGPTLLPRASLVAGLAIAEALGPAVRVKWPNDLLVATPVGWRKLGGILCERVAGVAGDAVWLCGIGLNVRAVPAGMAATATSLHDLAERPQAVIDLSELAADLCMAVRRGVGQWLDRDGQLDVLGLQDRLAFVGSTIEMDLGPLQGRREAVLLGLDATGALRVLTPQGHEVVQPLCITASRGELPWRAG